MANGQLTYMQVKSTLLEAGYSPEEISRMDGKTQFAAYCQWHGLIGWSETLWNVVLTLALTGEC